VAVESDKAVMAVLKWCGWRRPEANEGQDPAPRLWSDTGESRAAKARLRRTTTVFDALLLAETHALIKQVREAGDERLPRDADERLAVLAMTLAHLEKSSDRPFAAALGFGPDGRPPDLQAGDRPRVSPPRFRALMRAAHERDWDSFARATRRAVAILGDSAFNAYGFVRDVLRMNDRTLQRWTYQYWQTDAPRGGGDSRAAQPSSAETESVR
jgi:CRISPR type I-E-associated protein CasB/Cse2